MNELLNSSNNTGQPRRNLNGYCEAQPNIKIKVYKRFKSGALFVDGF